MLKKNKELVLGEVVATTAGNLSTLGIKHVIHVAGPDYSSFHSNIHSIRACLIKAFYNVYKCANDELKVSSVSIPALSAGKCHFSSLLLALCEGYFAEGYILKATYVMPDPIVLEFAELSLN